MLLVAPHADDAAHSVDIEVFPVALGFVKFPYSPTCIMSFVHFHVLFGSQAKLVLTWFT